MGLIAAVSLIGLLNDVNSIQEQRREPVRRGA
jgi:hypothetical protein